jgi:uncharacterized membrane protein YccF (DUF307 family)
MVGDDPLRRLAPVAASQSGDPPSLVVRAVWFLLVGWWASGVVLAVAWLLNLTIIGIPLGIKLINRVPWVVSLKTRTVETEVLTEGGEVSVRNHDRDQHSLVVRAAWYLLVGWWLSGIWLSIAWTASVSIVGLPVAVWMYGKLPWIVSLYRY